LCPSFSFSLRESSNRAACVKSWKYTYSTYRI
jgi:hypothetical protein